MNRSAGLRPAAVSPARELANAPGCSWIVLALVVLEPFPSAKIL